LLALSFVEPHGKRGYRLHELTRKAILGHWLNDAPQPYRALSRRATNILRANPAITNKLKPFITSSPLTKPWRSRSCCSFFGN